MFWINLYNATVQNVLKTDSSSYKKKMAFFGKKQLVVAGKNLSLNDIEHGILRKGQWIYGQGRIRSWLPGNFKKRNRVDTMDVRIHFALNCGAKSCPPIFFYTVPEYESQIEHATTGFLNEPATLKKMCLNSRNCSFSTAEISEIKNRKSLL